LPGYSRQKDGVMRGEFVAFSPYGLWLATAYGQRVSFRLPSDGTELFTWKSKSIPASKRITTIRFDAKGNTMLTFFEDTLATRIAALKFLQFDIDSREERTFIGNHGVVDGRVTADNKYVVTWDNSPEIVFWDLINRKEIAAIKVAREHVYDVAFSPTAD